MFFEVTSCLASVTACLGGVVIATVALQGHCFAYDLRYVKHPLIASPEIVSGAALQMKLWSDPTTTESVLCGLCSTDGLHSLTLYIQFIHQLNLD